MLSSKDEKAAKHPSIFFRTAKKVKVYDDVLK